MTSLEWPNLHGVDADRLASARRLAHNAIHWLVRFANSYAEPGADEQTPLIWNARDLVIETRPFLDQYSVELRVAPLEMQFRENGAPAPHTLVLQEHTPAHVEAWALVELLHRGIDRSRFTKDLPYRPNDLMSGDHEDFEPIAYQQELAAIDLGFRAGATVIQALYQRETGEASDAPLSCWPEPFQIGFEIDLALGSGAKRLRIGIAPGDGVRSEPYFFVGTEQQAQTAGFARECVISLRDAEARGLDVDSMAALLAEVVATQKRRLAG